MNLNDAFVIDGVRKTSDGYLAAFARVARTGIQVYKGHELGRPDLDTVRVYRSPEEVFHEDSLKSYAHRPVTLRHPSTPVTSKNWRRHAGGQTGDEVVRDGDFVRVPLVMMDAALIDAYERDGIKELSMGYSTDIKWRTGVTDAGEPYDAVQTAIRANHLAVVPQARGGDKLRIGDNEIEDNINEGDYTMKLVIDGINVNVADDQTASIIERHIASLNSQLKTVNDSFEEFKKKKKEDDEEAVKTKDAISAKDGEIAVLKKQVADAAITPEKLDVLVKDRLAVVDKAKVLLGDKYVFDGKSVETIRKDAVVLSLGDSAKDMDDATVVGAFVALTKDAKPANSATQIADALRSRPHSASQTVDARDAAYADNIKHLENNWKTPSAA